MALETHRDARLAIEALQAVVADVQTAALMTPETVRDIIGAAILGSDLVQVAYNDVGDTITITTTATQNWTNGQLTFRPNHTGEQAMSTVTGLVTALDGKVPVEGLAARVADFFVAGANTTIAFDEATGTITITATGGGGSVGVSGDALGMPTNPIRDPNAQRPAWATPAGINVFWDTSATPVNWRDDDWNWQVGS